MKQAMTTDNLEQPLERTDHSTDLNDLDDGQLLEKIQECTDISYDAFSILVQRHSRRFYALAYRLLGSQHEAEDIIQDCFLRLWHRSELWNPDKGAQFTTWFSRIVLNECRMHHRKNTRNAARPQHSEDSMDYNIEQKSFTEHETMENQLDTHDKKNRVKEALDQLVDRQKEAIILCFYEEHSNKEAANIMDISVKALESLIMRAKKQLREIIS